MLEQISVSTTESLLARWRSDPALFLKQNATPDEMPKIFEALVLNYIQPEEWSELVEMVAKRRFPSQDTE